MTSDPLVRVERVVKEFPVTSGGFFTRRRERIHAVSDV